MSGYLRIPARAWEPEHYRAAWSSANPAPEWWVAIDVAWSLDREEVPSVRTSSSAWGWKRTRAWEAIRAVIEQQLAWESRPEKQAFLRAALVRGRSADTDVEKPTPSRERAADTRPTENAENRESERTPGGQNADETRTETGRLVRAFSSPPTSTSTAEGGSAREAPPEAPETPDPSPSVETACLPDTLHGLMPEARMDLVTRLARVGHIETPEQLLGLSVSELGHSPGIGWAMARAVEAELAKGPWRLRADDAPRPRGRAQARASPAKTGPPIVPRARSADPASPDYDPELLEELIHQERRARLQSSSHPEAK